jgi:hypothetical protein
MIDRILQAHGCSENSLGRSRLDGSSWKASAACRGGYGQAPHGKDANDEALDARVAGFRGKVR